MGNKILNENSEKVFFNADLRKSNADKRRFSNDTSATICVQSAGIRVQEGIFQEPLNNRGQGILEMTFVIIIIVLFLGGVFNIWLWANKQIGKRQIEYNRSRVIAGTSSDTYTLQWPVFRPEELGEERVLLDTGTIPDRSFQ